MRIDPIKTLLDENFIINKKFYLISGNEITLMEKISSLIIEKYKKNKKIFVKNIDSLSNFVNEIGLFENKRVYFGKNCKEINEENISNIENVDGIFIFIQENSQKLKKIKNFFIKHKDSYVFDCYELDRSSKIKILNEFLRINNFEISDDVYWFLVDRLDNKYMLFEKNLIKVLELGKQEITLDKIKKILTVDVSGKERIFFNLFRKNKEIIGLYRDKIINHSDVNELYYYCKFFCQLIIDSNSEDEYKKKIPLYLFKEKNYLIDVYRKYNSKKKKILLKLLSSTESVLRKENDLSLIFGLRFLLNIKKITIS